MIRHQRFLLVALLSSALAACGGDGHSYLAVTVSSGQPLTATSLEVALTNAMMSAHVSITHGTSFTIPPDQSFAIQVDGRKGNLDVDVRALGATGELAHESGSVGIVEGGTAHLTLALLPSPTDGGGPIDGAGPDLAGSCTDGIKNGSETDIDCGGACPNKCDQGRACGVATDCITGYCNSDKSVCGPAHCANTLTDADETDIDCGGTECGGCGADKLCAVNSDCSSNNCVTATSKFCALASGTPKWLPASGTLMSPGTDIHGGPGTSYNGSIVGVLEYNSIVDGVHIRAYKYDSTAQAFDESAFPADLTAVGLVFDSTGKLYAMEGGTASSPSKALQVWNGTAWISLADVPVGHTAAATVLGPDGRLYSIGGQSPSTNVGDLYAYDIAANSWSSLPYMTRYIYECAGASAGNSVYCIGGNEAAGSPHADGEAFDLTQKKWRTIASMSTARIGASAITAPDGRIYMIGGAPDGNASDALASVEAYSPAGDHWAPVASLTTARVSFCAGIGADGRIYAYAGSYSDGSGVHYPAGVEAYGPLATLTPASAAAGSMVTIAGGNFAADARVSVYWTSATGALLATGTTDANGSLTAPIPFTVPSAAVAGSYKVVVIDNRSQYAVTPTLKVQ